MILKDLQDHKKIVKKNLYQVKGQDLIMKDLEKKKILKHYMLVI